MFSQVFSRTLAACICQNSINLQHEKKIHDGQITKKSLHSRITLHRNQNQQGICATHICKKCIYVYLLINMVHPGLLSKMDCPVIFTHTIIRDPLSAVQTDEEEGECNSCHV